MVTNNPIYSFKFDSFAQMIKILVWLMIDTGIWCILKSAFPSPRFTFHLRLKAQIVPK